MEGSFKYCIYKITNLINNKVYIGSTKSYNRRISYHKSDLNNNKHINNHLQAAWNKYGKDNFLFEIVEEVKNSEELLKIELINL